MIETLGEKLYTSREVSVYLGVCLSTLANYAKKAGIPRRFIRGKAYPSAVIKPWKNRVTGIAEYNANKNYYIFLVVRGGTSVSLPPFKSNLKYKGMEIGKRYALEELGL